MTTPHEVDRNFDPTAMTAVAQAVIAHPRVIHQPDATCGALVLAFRDELLVRRVPEDDVEYRLVLGRLHQAEAVQSGALSDGPGPPGGLPADYDVEIWRLDNQHGDAFAQARQILAEDPRRLIDHNVPKVSPNHISVACAYDMCPGGPPGRRGDKVPPTVPELRRPEAGPKGRTKSVSIVVIDTGYISGHPALDGRGGIRAEPGQWFDTAPSPGCWRDSPPDDFVTYLDTQNQPRLPGVAGHGTFIAGIVGHICADVEITVVGHRHECLPVEWTDEVDKLRLFTSEIAIARSVLRHRCDDVISCGFAFPTLDGLESIPFDIVMPHVSGDTAVVAPAGNEDSACAHWPAAHPDVIGVAATDPAGTAKAVFSNWGEWVDCCSIGVDVLSTFGDVVAFPQDYDPLPGEAPWEYDGWATWDGTSFAAPKVAAEIACAAANSSVSPRSIAPGLGVSTVEHNTITKPYVP